MSVVSNCCRAKKSRKIEKIVFPFFDLFRKQHEETGYCCWLVNLYCFQLWNSESLLRTSNCPLTHHGRTSNNKVLQSENISPLNVSLYFSSKKEKILLPEEESFVEIFNCHDLLNRFESNKFEMVESTKESLILFPNIINLEEQKHNFKESNCTPFLLRAQHY